MEGESEKEKNKFDIIIIDVLDRIYLLPVKINIQHMCVCVWIHLVSNQWEDIAQLVERRSVAAYL